MTALALREDQNYWDESQLAVLRQTGIDEGVTKAELQAFLHECQMRRLDPFTRQIYLIGRWDNQKKRKVYRSQTSIDGFRLIARRAADEARESIEYEDTLWCGPDGQWVDVWLANEPPTACKVVVLRDGKRFPSTARFASYVQTSNDGAMVGLWRKMPDGQIAKCTEALALRKAFPEELGGIYAEEEMAQADNPQRVHVTAEVVKDEPAAIAPQGSPHEDPWITHPDPDADPEWDAKVARMGTFGADDEGRELWKAVNDRRDAGKLDGRQVNQLKGRINKRWKELKEAAEAAAVDGAVVAPLDPADPWYARVEEIASHNEAEKVAGEVAQAETAGEVDGDKAASIYAAISAREAALHEGAAA